MKPEEGGETTVSGGHLWEMPVKVLLKVILTSPLLASL